MEKAPRISKLEEFVTLLDIYTNRIGFTYKNKDEFKSWVGGLFTILTLSLIIGYLIFSIQEVTSFKVTIQNQEEKRDFFHNPEEVNFPGYPIYENVVYRGTNKTVAANPMIYFSIESKWVNGTWNNSEIGQIYQHDSKNLPIELCDQEYLIRYFGPQTSQGQIGLQFCLKDQNLRLKAGTSSENFYFYALNINECNQEWLDKFQPGSQCAPLEDQLIHIGDFAFFTTFKDQYFEGKNQEAPIRDSSKTFTFYSVGLFQEFSFLHLGMNEAILEDSWLHPSIYKRTVNYTTVTLGNQGRKKYYNGTESSNFLGLLIFLDDNIKVNQRTRSNLFQVISQVGGFATSVIGFIHFFLKFYQKNQFLDNLFQSSYYNNEREEFENQKNSEQKLRILGKDSAFFKSCNPLKAQKQSQQNLQTQLDKELKKLKKEEKQIVKSYFWTCLTSFCCQERKSKIQFNSAFYKLHEELDIHVILRKIRKFDLFLELFLSPAAMKILKHLTSRQQLFLLKQQETKGYRIETKLIQRIKEDEQKKRSIPKHCLRQSSNPTTESLTQTEENRKSPRKKWNFGSFIYLGNKPGLKRYSSQQDTVRFGE